MNVVEG